MVLKTFNKERQRLRDLKIVERVKSGESPKNLAKEFNLCFEHIQRICKRLSVDWVGHKQSRTKRMSLEDTVKWVLSQCTRTESGCLLWHGHTRKGYGRIRFEGKLVCIHRLVAEYNLGRKLGPLECVCHKCDTRNCSEFSHYFISDNAGNVADREAKGRNVVKRGSEHGSAILNEEKVIAIKEAIRNGAVMSRLAREYGVCADLIYKIKYGKLWKHVL